MAHNFQQWLTGQGYYRGNGGAWMKNGRVVSGKELNDKLNEWKVFSVSTDDPAPIPPQKVSYKDWDINAQISSKMYQRQLDEWEKRQLTENTFE